MKHYGNLEINGVLLNGLTVKDSTGTTTFLDVTSTGIEVYGTTFGATIQATTGTGLWVYSDSGNAIQVQKGNYLIGYTGYHDMILGGSLVTDGWRIRNSANTQTLLSVDGTGVLAGGASGALYQLGGTSSNSIMAQGGFNLGSTDYNSNFRLTIFGNSEIVYNAQHSNGNTLNLSYFGGNNWSIYKGGTSPAILHSIIGTEEIRTGINATNTNIENSACAQFESTSQGFLPPRMTTEQKNSIPSPANALIVFDTDLDDLYIYKSSAGAWVVV